jgi:hypothetical protein
MFAGAAVGAVLDLNVGPGAALGAAIGVLVAVLAAVSVLSRGDRPWHRPGGLNVSDS